MVQGITGILYKLSLAQLTPYKDDMLKTVSLDCPPPLIWAVSTLKKQFKLVESTDAWQKLPVQRELTVYTS